EGMQSLFIESEGPIQIPNAETGEPELMTAQSTSLAALLVSAHTVMFLLLTIFFVWRRQVATR
ncbi:MAG: hypothetical protein AAGC77_00930, partial [Pseudomonadota bacterium]